MRHWILAFSAALSIAALITIVPSAQAASSDNPVEVLAAPTAADFASSSATLGADCGCQPKCCYNPCIKYVHRKCRRRVCCDCGCTPPQKVVMTVKDPCKCGCAVDVPMCIPACCKGTPCVKSKCGLFCRGIVTYEWCCGFKARVVINKCGDITVTYFGS